MKPPRFKPLALATIGLALTAVSSPAATYTWDGGGGNGNWSTGANWVGDTAPSGTGHVLVFSGNSQTASANNGLLTQVGGLTFSENAAAFTLSGSNLTLGGNILNSGTAKQTISLNLALSAHREFNARYGDLEIGGIISANYNVRKTGLETLTLSGSNTYTGWTQVMAGRLVLDASTGTIPGGTYAFQLGQVTGGYDVGNNAAFEVKGGNYNWNHTLGVYNYGANRVKAGANVALTFTDFTNTPYGTINFDVAAAGSSIVLTGAVPSTGDLNRIHLATVTDGTKTGFARKDGSNNVVRFTDGELTDLSSNPATSQNTQTRLNGNLVLTASKSVNSLTLQGAGGGTISGATQELTVREILMEEGAGNYVFSNARIVQHGLAPAFVAVHQYSTSGTMIFHSALLSNAATQGFIKTGPGTVLISNASNSNYTGETRVQSGRLDLDGTLSATGVMRVFDGATLAGGGSYGATTTATRVYAGGTLAGTSTSALAISGSLTLESDSAFSFTLGAGSDYVSVTGAVTLQSNAILQLAVSGTPAFDTPLYLIRSGTSITGSFVYNGATMGDGATFSLGGYDFTYRQDADDIWVTTVPEPSVAVLVGLGITALLLARRVRGRIGKTKNGGTAG